MLPVEKVLGINLELLPMPEEYCWTTVCVSIMSESAFRRILSFSGFSISNFEICLEFVGVRGYYTCNWIAAGSVGDPTTSMAAEVDFHEVSSLLGITSS
jgi:hypothetical protein